MFPMKLRLSAGEVAGEKRSRFTPSRTVVLVVGLFALLIVGISVYNWVSAHRSILLLSQDPVPPPATAVFVPKQAPAVMSVLANIDELASLNRLVTPSSRHWAAHQAIERWKQQLADRLHLDYRREIAPWLGTEFTVAMTEPDYDRLPQNGAQPGYLAVLSSRNPSVSNQIIHAWWDRQVAANRLTFESDRGVKLSYNRRDKLASAIVGDKYILFANHPKVLRAAINHLQTPNLSILENPEYQKVVAANNHHKIGIIYARLPELQRWLGKSAGEQYPLAGINLGIDRQGLFADISLYPTTADATALRRAYANELNPPTTSTIPRLVNTLTYLPAQSKIAIAGTDLSNWQQQLITTLPELKPLIPSLEKSLSKISTQIGIDLSQDIFSWTTGEYALAAIPNPSQTATDWAFIAERTQPDRVDAAIAHFDELASLAGYNVGLLPWTDKQVIGWTKLVTETTSNTARLIAQVSGVHTTIADKYTIWASSLAAMDSTLKAIDQQSILDSDRYLAGANLLTATATGYLYGDWRTMSHLLPQQFREQSLVKLIGDGILSGLPHISASSSISSGVQQITLFFQVDR
jgi:Protein of unknown function (DUF3352)